MYQLKWYMLLGCAAHSCQWLLALASSWSDEANGTGSDTLDSQDRVETRSPRDDAVRLTVAASAFLMAAHHTIKIADSLSRKTSLSRGSGCFDFAVRRLICALYSAHGTANYSALPPRYLQSSISVASIVVSISSSHHFVAMSALQQ